MKDDFSNVPTGASCYSFNSATSLYVYRNNTRDTYTQIGGKWYKTASSSYTNVPTNTVCWSYSDVIAINSKAEFFPIYEFIAILLALFVWFFVYKLISRLIKWRP